MKGSLGIPRLWAIRLALEAEPPKASVMLRGVESVKVEAILGHVILEDEVGRLGSVDA